MSWILTLVPVTPIKLLRAKAKFILGASIDIISEQLPYDAKTLKGLPAKLVEMTPVVPTEGTGNDGPFSEINVPDYFPPGSIMVFETHVPDHDASLDSFCKSGAQAAFSDLDLVDLNIVLHRADQEERGLTEGKFGAYDVPGLGKMVYCGLEGFMHPLRHIMRNNDLGHPLCEHLRKGPWALDYTHARLYQ